MNPDDRSLIADALAGQTDAFGLLVLRYQDRLFNSVVRVVENADDALDAVQDAFVNAYVNLASFKGDAEFYTWLYRIAFNSAITLKRRRRPVLSLDFGLTSHPDRNAGFDPADPASLVGPGVELERAEEDQILLVALGRLSLEHRTVLVMKDIDGLKYEEIAQVIDVPIGTVRSRIHRARMELKALLASVFETDADADDGAGEGSHVDRS